MTLIVNTQLCLNGKDAGHFILERKYTARMRFHQPILYSVEIVLVALTVHICVNLHIPVANRR